MVLVLRQDGAQLQLQFALLVDTPVAMRDFLALVESRFTDERNALLEVEDALFKHAELLEAHRHVVVCDE